jgi:LmbE family N-acetylglucosaminyl deacetylase
MDDGGILAIFAHPDDETFGCGGTLALHAEMGYNVSALSLTCSNNEREKELKNAAKTLDINEPFILNEKTIEPSPKITHRVSKVITEQQPQIIITHLPYDYHREHRLTHQIVKEAVEWAGHTTIYDPAWTVNRLLLMEVNTLIPKPQIIVDISKTFHKKQRAIQEYKSQLAKFQWGYYQNFNEKKAQLRGIQGSCQYAEVFQEISISKNSPFFPNKSTKSLI